MEKITLFIKKYLKQKILLINAASSRVSIIDIIDNDGGFRTSKEQHASRS